MTTPKDGTQTTLRSLLDGTATYAAGFLDGLPERKVATTATAEELRKELGGPLPEARIPEVVVRSSRGRLILDHGTPSGRFFGFVIGGSLPAALAADWLLGLGPERRAVRGCPAASVVEEVCGAWLIELFGLPEHVSWAGDRLPDGELHRARRRRTACSRRSVGT